jgi:hypothetical protein
LEATNYLLKPALIARVRAIAMLLMAERPPIAESIGHRAEAFFAKIGKGDGIMRGRDGTYLVVKNGVTYTTSTRPTWVHEEDIMDDKGLVPVTTRRDKLIRTVNALTRISSAVVLTHNEFNISQITHRIRSHYDSPAAECEMEFEELMALIGGFGSKELFTGGDDDAIRHITNAMMDAVLQHANRLHVCGNVAAPIVALLAFFHDYSRPGDLWQIGILAERTPANPDGDVNFWTRSPNIWLYLMQSQVNPGAAITAINTAATRLRKLAWHRRREAMQESDMVNFHMKLYSSFLTSQASLHLYNQLKYCGTVRPELLAHAGLSVREVHRQWVEVEEARVAIMASLSFVATPNKLGPNIADPETFLLTLAHWLDVDGQAELERVIHDMAFRLLCPELLRDFALGWLDVRTGRFDDFRVRRLQRVADRFEQDLARNALAGNLDYLSETYRLLAALHRMCGDQASAAECESRCEANNFHQHVQVAIDKESDERCAHSS